VKQCEVCGKKLKIVTHYHSGYQGQDWTDEGPEDHRRDDCIKHLAAELQKVNREIHKLRRMLGINTNRKVK
jgi:hypothetical protein